MRDELQGKYEQYSTFFKDSTCDLTLNSTTVAHDANASIVVGLEVSNDNIPAGTSLELLSGGKVVMETTDVLKIDCSGADKVSGTLSIMEIT